jgi:hypothetical protein
MEMSSSREATSCAATQELPSILWNTKVYYRAEERLEFFLILSEINPG